MNLVTKKKVFISLAAFVLLVFAFGIFVRVHYPVLARHPYRYLVRLANEIIGSSTFYGESASHHIRVRDAYPLHLRAGIQYGWEPLNNKTIAKLKKQKKLVPVKEDDGFYVSALTTSTPVLTKSAYNTLVEIGNRFRKETGAGNYFTITSLTRTVEHQKRLSRVNKAATKGVSSHNYGCSFDISYVRFNGRRGANPKLQRALEKILLDIRKEKRLLLIAETSSRCYHITVPKRK
jgi:hypothetical protein